jgi:trigger factor
MKTTVKKLSDTKVVLTIVVGRDELEAAEQVALKKLSRDVKVPGFRKGHVPLSVVAKNINPNALQEQTLDNALSKAVADAFTTESIQAIERPEVEVKKFVPGDTLEFTAEATVLPEVKLPDYKKLKSRRADVKVTDADTEDIISRMQENFVEKTEVKRAAQNGDEVVIDFVGKKDGVEFDGGKAENYSLKLGAGQFIPGFEEGVVGHKAGDSFDVELKFPKDYHVGDLAGQPVVFSVTLHAVNETTLPELTDEFAAKCGPFTSMDELRADILREVEEQKKREADEKFKDELVGELADKVKVSLPEVLVEDQIRSIEQDMQQNLSYRGVELESYLSTQGFKDKEDWMAKEVRPAAEKRVKAGLVLAELSRELEIDVTHDELSAQIDTLKQYYGKDAKTAKQFDNPDVHRDIANRLITDKTIAKLVELNTK